MNTKNSYFIDNTPDEFMSKIKNDKLKDRRMLNKKMLHLGIPYSNELITRISNRLTDAFSEYLIDKLFYDVIYYKNFYPGPYLSLDRLTYFMPRVDKDFYKRYLDREKKRNLEYENDLEMLSEWLSNES